MKLLNGYNQKEKVKIILNLSFWMRRDGYISLKKIGSGID